ncbi:MAG: hypothetical protein D6706_02985 [Chloroflexi bacterium]|nr:MAG: hypothetical protein D6706_02985 [Chloroflexota bacterium]
MDRFQQARRRALFEQISARLRGRDVRLLPFDVIRAQLRQQNPMYRGVQEIPLDQIVGSVGRYREFTRRFLPLSDSLAERWVGVDALAADTGWPPIDVYKVGDVYFVKDGNHRVSVARQLEIPTIEAHVWEYPIDIEISPDVNLDELLIRLGERNFMERTGLDQLYPEHGIQFTTPGRYSELLVQIEELREKLRLIDEADVPYEEAVAAWYEIVYLPVVQIIREAGLMAEFPGRTEADLFVWLSKYRAQLQAQYGEYDSLEELVMRLVEAYREGGVQKIARQVRKLLGSEVLSPLEPPEGGLEEE